MATGRRAAKVTPEERARWERQVDALKDAEIDTELTIEQRKALLVSVNARRAESGRPPLALEDWVDTPPG